MSVVGKYNGVSAYNLRPNAIDTRGMNGAYTPNTIVQDSLYASYDFLNPNCYSGSGTQASDLSGNNNLTFGGGMESSYSQDGSFTTDGINDVAESSYNITLNNARLSIAVWVQIIDQGAYNIADVFSCTLYSGGVGIYIFRNQGNGNIGFRVADTVYGRNYNTKGTNLGFAFSKWYYICGSFDSTLAGGSIYVFDETGLAGSGSNTHATYADFSANPSAGAGIRIGSSPQRFSQNKVAEAHFYQGKALTEQEWTRNYNATKKRYGY